MIRRIALMIVSIILFLTGQPTGTTVQKVKTDIEKLEYAVRLRGHAQIGYNQLLEFRKELHDYMKRMDFTSDELENIVKIIMIQVEPDKKLHLSKLQNVNMVLWWKTLAYIGSKGTVQVLTEELLKNEELCDSTFRRKNFLLELILPQSKNIKHLFEGILSKRTDLFLGLRYQLYYKMKIFFFDVHADMAAKTQAVFLLCTAFKNESNFENLVVLDDLFMKLYGNEYLYSCERKQFFEEKFSDLKIMQDIGNNTFFKRQKADKMKTLQGSHKFVIMECLTN